jgi:3-phosphoglycerate kinase
MPGIKYFPEDLDVEDKKVIVRLDLNVPLKNKKICDHTRIKLALPFLKDLVKKKAKIIIISHLGRPKEFNDKDLSLAPIYKYLKEKINTNIFFLWGVLMVKLKRKALI